MKIIPLDELEFYLDTLNRQEIAGWVLSEKYKKLFLGIFSDRRLIGIHPVDRIRSDVSLETEVGFNFSPTELFEDPREIQLSFLALEDLELVERTIYKEPEQFEGAKICDFDRRWKNEQYSLGLTWGAVLDELEFYIDLFNRQNIIGWVVSEKHQELFLGIFSDRRLIGIHPVDRMRLDIATDRAVGFKFSPTELFEDPRQIQLSFLVLEDLELIGQTIYKEPEKFDAARRYDFDRRWKNDEYSLGLTWGVVLDETSFFEVAETFAPLTGAKKVLEIGPGYGRLLQGLQKQAIDLASYVGVDLSQARVERLNQDLGNSSRQFVTGDARTVDLSHCDRFNLLISSSTFEHISPDFGTALQHLSHFLEEGAIAIFDLIDYGDPTLSRYEGCPTGVFVRIYSVDELEQITTQAGFKVLGIKPYEIRNSHLDPAIFDDREDRPIRREGFSYWEETTAIVHRYLVIAQKV
jgi:SAM-dependent methyltransferase